MREWVSKEAVLRICEAEKDCGNDCQRIIDNVKRLPFKRDTNTPWISVGVGLPEYGERVLVTEGHAVFEAFLSIGHKWVRNGICWLEGITHWMPMPKPTEEEGAEK